MKILKACCFSLLCSLCVSCAHFIGDIKHEFSTGNQQQLSKQEKTTWVRVERYLNWDERYTRLKDDLKKIIDESYKNKGIEVKWYSDADEKPVDFEEVVLLLDNGGNFENRPLSALSILSTPLFVISLGTIPMENSAETVLIKFNTYRNNEIVASTTYSGKIHEWAGLLMAPLTPSFSQHSALIDIADEASKKHMGGF